MKKTKKQLLAVKSMLQNRLAISKRERDKNQDYIAKNMLNLFAENIELKEKEIMVEFYLGEINAYRGALNLLYAIDV